MDSIAAAAWLVEQGAEDRGQDLEQACDEMRALIQPPDSNAER